VTRKATAGSELITPRFIETAYAQGGSSYRVDRTVVSTKTTKVAPEASVTAVGCRKP
jgi:hypothetical protein